jgi:hypothetical protein
MAEAAMLNTADSVMLTTELSKTAIEMHLASSWNCTDVFINEVVCGTLEVLNNAIEDDVRCETEIFNGSDENAAGREGDEDPVGGADILADLQRGEDEDGMDLSLEMKLSSMDRATLENLSENFSTGITAIKETVMTTVFLTDVDDAVFSAAGHEDLYLDIVSEKTEVDELENPEQKAVFSTAGQAALYLNIVNDKTKVEELENPEQKEKEASEEREKKAVALIESSFLPSEAIAKSTGNLPSIYLDDNDGKTDNCECAFLPLIFKSKKSLHGGM